MNCNYEKAGFEDIQDRLVCSLLEIMSAESLDLLPGIIKQIFSVPWFLQSGSITAHSQNFLRVITGLKSKVTIDISYPSIGTIVHRKTRMFFFN
jgi:hypothetical protein